MHVTLPPRLEGLVRRKVESGLYSGPDEVVGEALRLLVARDELAEARLQRLRAALVEGEASGFVDGFAIDDLLGELDGEAAAEPVGRS